MVLYYVIIGEAKQLKHFVENFVEKEEIDFNKTLWFCILTHKYTVYEKGR